MKYFVDETTSAEDFVGIMGNVLPDDTIVVPDDDVRQLVEEAMGKLGKTCTVVVGVPVWNE